MHFAWSDFIWTLINFFVLLFILKILLYKPVLKTIEDRKRSIEESLEKAAKAQEEAERIKAEYDGMIAKAREEAREIIAKAQKTAQAEKEEIIATAQREAQSLLADAKATIAQEKEKALRELRQEIGNLAVLAAGKILNRAVTLEDHQKLVDEFLNEVKM
ncbi:F0F1 ATP synthase subunit B [Carboxydothermus ferrireducens]|uniref:ATP synthase subunit b n=1 Tax=Carboxydothermus ferrireducens DSM 11255 TaxID=1119529 RepID=A0ABX2RCW2_9THEO|nr:F0F1 ATP synthase subunit B [Carboxydothermus ferrireducens]NYE57715.1 F-type H+-transporting ATPase subunit b [Carboxydothermus ferrireducens DSM 11255]